jgi:hypothetical protein
MKLHNTKHGTDNIWGEHELQRTTKLYFLIVLLVNWNVWKQTHKRSVYSITKMMKVDLQ